MHDISSLLFSGVIESSDVLISGMSDMARRTKIYIRRGLDNLPGRSHRTLCLHPASVEHSREVAITYYGRTAENLRMTSERIAIPAGDYTLGQLMCSLYRRGDQWVEELDDSSLVCTVNGREAMLFDTIEPGAEIRIASSVH